MLRRLRRRARVARGLPKPTDFSRFSSGSAKPTLARGFAFSVSGQGLEKRDGIDRATLERANRSERDGVNCDSDRYTQCTRVPETADLPHGPGRAAPLT